MQTNASVDSSETSTKQLEYRLNLLSLVWTLSPADWSLRSGVRCRLPLSVVPRQLPTSQSVCLTLSLASPSTSGHGEILSPKPFVWFRAKTDKGIVCLVGHLHSVVTLDLHMIDNLSIADHAFTRCTLTSISVDEILLPRYMNLSTNFKGLPIKVEMVPSSFKQRNPVLFAFLLQAML